MIRIRPFLLAVLLACCISNGAQADDFASQFHDTPNRVWVGPQYWANPMEDWSLVDGRLECRGGGNRNLVLLTRTLTGTQSFDISLRLGRLAKGAAPGSAGLRIGVRDEVDDYRAAALRGKGLDVGLNARTGELFIGGHTGGKLPQIDAWDGLQLKLIGRPAGKQCALTLSAKDARGTALATAQTNVPVDAVRGVVALVNNHQAKDKPAFWFSDWELIGPGVQGHADRSWGPILWAMHTLHHTHGEEGVVLKLTAQLAPIGDQGARAQLLVATRDAAAEARVDPLSCTATFRIANWDPTQAAKYTVRYGEAAYTGTIRAEPAGRPLVVAGFTGNQDYAFPNNTLTGNVRAQDPDMLFFSGDQIYEGVGGYGIVRAPTDSADRQTIRRATLNYLRKWYLLGWAFGDLMRDRPTICLPDDHDVYQGNIWGQGGINAHGIRNHAQGGFAEHPDFLNAVIRTQCSHHPDLPDPTPMQQGIQVFYGPLNYGRVSFAILADRYFKSGPEGKVNSWKGRPDHVRDTQYDVSKLDQPGLELLGQRQEAFLQRWVGDWRGADFKCVLSQTIFCNLANYHGGGRQFIFADLDSNGWPQTSRNNAIRIMRRGYAFHYAGDQHLPSITQNGVDTWGDAGFAFCVPSIAAGYPRSWLPDKEGRAVQNRPAPGLPNTGEYRDGFGNHVTVYGVGNPADKNRSGRENTAHDKSSGHGIVRFDPRQLTITMECYRLQIDRKNTRPSDQFPGWPKTIKLADNRGQKIASSLPEIKAPAGVQRPVLRVSRADSGELVYALRMSQSRVKPWVYLPGKYKVEFGDPDTGRWTTATHSAAAR